MKNRTQVGSAKLCFIGIVLLCFSFSLVFYGCEESPFKPEIVDIEPLLEDYTVYCWDGSSEREFFGYHPTTGVIDSFALPFVFPWHGFQVSADGKNLYIQQQTSFSVVGLDSLNLIIDLPYLSRNGLAVSPDGKWLALQGGGLKILSTSDYSIAHEDTTLGVFGGVFTQDSKQLYLIGGGSDSTIVIVDMENSFSQSMISFPPGPPIYDIIPSPDEFSWYLIRSSRYARVFEVWDVASDSIIFQHYLWPGEGETVVSPNGHYVFFTEAGDIQDGYGPPYFTVFDTQKNRISKLVATGGIDDGMGPKYLPLGELAITPDGNWLIAGEGIGGQSFIRFNIRTMEIDAHPILTGEGLRSYTCQNSK